MHWLKQTARFLAGGSILFYTLPLLMLLTVWGTMAQKYIGLFDSIDRYFHAWVAWIGFVPFPGGLTLISLIFISLLINFLFYSEWSWRKAGIHLSHFGVLVLLIGGIVTITSKQEGYMLIPEGQSKTAYADYTTRIFKIGDQVFDFAALRQDQVIETDSTTLRIATKCDNCSVQAPSGAYENLQGLAVNMELFPIADELNKEANFSGLMVEVIKPEEQAGTYLMMEDVPKNPVIAQQELKITRAETALPFSITLDDFRKITYPGTTKASAYESDLIIQDGDVSWPATIEMNKPLRYKGYTFFQSSFVTQPNIEMTVLNVVKNSGALFPYIATFLIFFGLLLHAILRGRA